MEYKSLRWNGSDVHVYEWDPATTPSQVGIGVPGKKEKLSQITHGWYDDNGYEIAAKVNLGFFHMSSHVLDHIGIMWRDGQYVSIQNANNGVEIYLDSENRLQMGNIAEAQAKTMKDSVRWGGSLSYGIIRDGKKSLEMTANFSHHAQRHPRTMIAQKANKRMGIIVVDGRNMPSRIQSGSKSVGVNSSEQAALLLSLGYVIGANADGGGSSEMIVNGKIVNNPSDGSERSIGSALLVLKPKAPAPKKPDYVLDPGHGGTDPGGGSNKLWKEKDYALAFSKDLRERLEDHGLLVDMTRTTDVGLDSVTRTDLVKSSGADTCISIHVNAIDGDPDGGVDASGYEAIHSVYSDGALAKKLGEAVKAAGMTFRRVFSRRNDSGGDYYFMHRLTGNVSTIISELGFADNHRDVELLQALRTKILEAHVKTMVEHKGKKYDGGPKIVTPPAPDPEPDKPIDKYPADLPEWKRDAVEWLYHPELQILTGDEWKQKVDEAPPLWAVAIMMQRLYNNLKGE